MPSHASPNDSPSPSILLRPQQIAEHPTVSHWPPAVTWTDQCCGSRHLRHKSKSLWCLRISPTINTPTILYIYYILRIYTWKNSQKGEILRWMSLVSPTTTDPLRHWKRPFSGHLLRTWTGFRSASVAWNWVPKVRKSLRIFFGGSIKFWSMVSWCFFCLLILLLGFFAKNTLENILNSMRFFEIKYLLNFLWFLEAIGFWGPHLLHDFRVVQHQIQLRAVLEELAHHWDSVKAERDFHVSKKWPGPRNQHIPPNRKRKKNNLPLSFQTEKGIYVCFFQDGIC